MPPNLILINPPKKSASAVPAVLPRSFVEDHDIAPDIALDAGLNVPVFKVVNEFGYWLGSIRLTGAQGNPVKGIKVTLDPEAKD
ncbi:MAG: hypothetical protein ABSF95_06735 [Verrucomicrobiota bacterium]